MNPLIIDIIAAACHQQNKTYCESIGDTTQASWADAPEWQKQSAISGVKAAVADPRPGASHVNWMRDKVADGWVYGKIKDAEAKTHPCLVPFCDLPKEQQRKDELFVEMVVQLLGADQ